MKCRECSQEIEFGQTYFVMVEHEHIRFHHVCYMYLKPRRIMELTGAVIPNMLMRNDKTDQRRITDV